MGSSLVTYGGGGLSRRESRALSRDLDVMQAQGRRDLARIHQVGVLQQARTRMIGDVHRAAVEVVTEEARHSAAAARLAPEAAAAIAHLGDALTLALDGVITETKQVTSIGY
jgi:tRNA G18 (ribose-2'-O)-methylase SpoU